jgi:peroxiredoxin
MSSDLKKFDFNSSAIAFRRLLINFLLAGFIIFSPNASYSLDTGSEAPPIILESNNGKIFNLRRHVKNMKPGSYTAFAFFSITCIPCIKEMKDLQVIYDKSKHNGFDVYLICVDLLKNTPKDKIRSFLDKIGVKMPLLYDAHRRAGKSYGIITSNGEAKLPGLFVINIDRKIVIYSDKYSEKTIAKLQDLVK